MGKCRGCCLIHARMLQAAETASFSWFGGAVPSPNIQGFFFHRPQSLRIYHDSIFLYFLRSLSYCMFFIKHTHSSQNGARRIELENRSGTVPVGTSSFLFRYATQVATSMIIRVYLVGGLEHVLIFPFSWEWNNHHPN